MLSYLADFESFFGPLRLFRYLSLRIAFCGLTSMMIGFFVGFFIRIACCFFILGSLFISGRLAGVPTRVGRFTICALIDQAKFKKLTACFSFTRINKVDLKMI